MLAVAMFFALGTWQMHRRASKLELIARVEARIHAAPVTVPPVRDWPAVTAVADEYRPVTATGTFLHDKSALVQAVTERGGGYWLVTPLRQEDGTIVFVNRGFVPFDRRDAVSRPSGHVTVTGLLRMSEPGGGFLRVNDPAADRWYSRDVQALAAARGLHDVAPFFIDAGVAGEGYPVGGLTVVRFANNHLVYAFTWYMLSLLLAVVTMRAGRTTDVDP